jgi:RNA polymerase sigma factor (sigma-70 family)
VAVTLSLDSLDYDLLDIKSAVENLPTIEQQVLRLYYGEGFTFREVAELLKMSESAVKRANCRGLDFLKKYLKGTDEIDG